MRELIHPGQLQGHVGVVVGAGVSGMAAARLLSALGARVRLLEKSPQNITPEIEEFAETHGIALTAGEHEKKHFIGADMVVPSPGVPVAAIREMFPSNRKVQVVSELELASWFVSEPVLAVTGTNGKTTTTSLIGHILKSAGKKVFVGGNIGTPLSAYLLNGDKAEIIVLEVSSFQLMHCRSFRPRVGVLLNFSPNHLDWHKDMKEYLDAKLSMFARQGPEDTAILPLEMKDTLEARQFTQARRVYFTATRRFDVPALPGEHNRANLEAAYLACKAFVLTDPEIKAGAASFQPLPHRQTLVAEKNGIRFVDDSKATTVDALMAALGTIDAPIRLLCGGIFKGGDLKKVLPLIREKVARVGLFGGSRLNFETAWKGQVDMFWEKDLKTALTRLYESAEPGDTVLLSPATSSFDQFKDYKDRGNAFKQAVKELK